LGLKTGGSKVELVDRIIAVDSQPVAQLVTKLDIVVCSDSGKRLIAARQDQLSTETRAAKARIEEFLMAGDAVGACNAYVAYTQAWRVYGSDRFSNDDIAPIAQVLEARPESLQHLDAETQSRLRAKAALSKLWKEGAYDDELEQEEEEADESIITDQDERWISHILFNAEYRQNLETAFPSDNDEIVVTVKCSRVPPPCPACRARAAGSFTPDNLPDFPAAGCTNPRGCEVEIDYEYREKDDTEEDDEDDQRSEVADFDEPSQRVGPTIATRLSRLKDLFESDLITKEEYERKKASILDEL